MIDKKILIVLGVSAVVCLLIYKQVKLVSKLNNGLVELSERVNEVENALKITLQNPQQMVYHNLSMNQQDVENHEQNVVKEINEVEEINEVVENQPEMNMQHYQQETLEQEQEIHGEEVQEEEVQEEEVQEAKAQEEEDEGLEEEVELE